MATQAQIGKLSEDQTPIALGYTTRWTQRRQKGITTGHRIFSNLDELVDHCRSVNAKWRGEIQQWAVEWEVSEKNEKIRELREIKANLGLEQIQNGR